MWIPIRNGAAMKLEVAPGIVLIREVKTRKPFAPLEWLRPARYTLNILRTALTPEERRAVRKFFKGAQIVANELERRTNRRYPTVL
jgi:hypothetical protein